MGLGVFGLVEETLGRGGPIMLLLLLLLPPLEFLSVSGDFSGILNVSCPGNWDNEDELPINPLNPF